MVKFGEMEWNERGLVTSKNQYGKVFLMGCQEYTAEDGSTVNVVFTPSHAFFFYDDGDEVLWSMSEMKDAYKSGSLEGQFPTDYDDNYIPICHAVNEDGEDFVTEIDMTALARFGLGVEAAQDISKRMNALKGFRVENDIMS